MSAREILKPILKAYKQLSLFDRMSQPTKDVLVHEKSGKTHMQKYHVAEDKEDILQTKSKAVKEKRRLENLLNQNKINQKINNDDAEEIKRLKKQAKQINMEIDSVNKDISTIDHEVFMGANQSSVSGKSKLERELTNAINALNEKGKELNKGYRKIKKEIESLELSLALASKNQAQAKKIKLDLQKKKDKLSEISNEINKNADLHEEYSYRLHDMD